MRTRTSTFFVWIQRLDSKDNNETCTEILMKEKSVKMFNRFFNSKLLLLWQKNEVYLNEVTICDRSLA